jgi:hypothetical protein
MATLVTGIASTPRVDSERHAVVPGAFALDRGVPLLWRHGDHDVKGAIGRIMSLTREGGRTLIKAVVEDDALAAKAVGFSINFGVRDYSVVNKGRPDYYATVTKAVLNEISLVLTPCNPDCIILAREPYHDVTTAYVKALHAHTDLMIRKLETLSKLAGAICPTPQA